MHRALSLRRAAIKSGVTVTEHMNFDNISIKYYTHGLLSTLLGLFLHNDEFLGVLPTSVLKLEDAISGDSYFSWQLAWLTCVLPKRPTLDG